MIGINWRVLLTKITPQLPYAAIALVVIGWFATYTHQQRVIGARDAQVWAADVFIKLNADSVKYYHARALISDHARDSIEQLLVGVRARAQRSDSVSHGATLAYRELRDQTLSAPSGSAVPTLPQIFASADVAVNACELAKADCKRRADLERARGDTARAAAESHKAAEGKATVALDSSRRNEKRLKSALPSTTGNVVRAGLWTSLGAGALWLVCSLVHCK